MNMADDQLDRDWKPNGRRPQSTIARSFSAELMDIFRIETDVVSLDEQVEKKKKEVESRNSELEALERRIREMEQRLKEQSPVLSTFPGELPSRAPPPVPGRKEPSQEHKSDIGGDGSSSSRPGTAKPGKQAIAGTLPPTPVASEDGDGERDA